MRNTKQYGRHGKDTVKPKAQRHAKYTGGRKVKHASSYDSKQALHQTNFQESKDWLGGDKRAYKIEPNQNAVSSSGNSNETILFRVSNDNAVGKNDGLISESFTRGTAYKIPEGMERVAHQQRRNNYDIKESDQRIQEFLWKNIRMTEEGRHLLKDHSLYDVLGCKWDLFKLRVEALFEPGMHWDNFGEWYLKTEPTEEQNSWHFESITPIWA